MPPRPLSVEFVVPDGQDFGEVGKFDVEFLGGATQEIDCLVAVIPPRLIRMPLAWPITSRLSMARTS